MAAIVLMGEQETSRFELGSRVILGRDPSSTVVLTDPRVSQTHAEIRRTEGGEYRLRNLSATNGTYVRGASVSEVALADGDPIVLGTTRFFFEDDRTSERTPAVRATLQQAAVQPDPTRSRAVRKTQPPPIDFKPQRDISDADQLRRDYEKLRGAYELLRAVDDQVTLDGVLERIVELSTALFGADRAVVYLIDPQSGEITPRMAKQRIGDPWQLRVSETVLREVAAQHTPLLCEDVELDSRFSHANSVVTQGIRTVMCVPMLHGVELLGLIYLDSRVSTKLFTATDLEVFAGIANQAASVVHSTTLRTQLREAEQRRSSAVRGLISGASHFINNPLAIIGSNLDLLAGWSRDLVAFHRAVLQRCPELGAVAADHRIQMFDEEIDPLCRESVAAACRIAGIVHAMRQFDQNPGDMVRLDLGELLVAAASRLEKATAEIARIHLRVEPDISVVGAAERLAQLLDNLILNAVQAIDPGAPQDNWILVCAQARGAQAVVIVEDSGRGIPPGEEDRVFAPFHTSRLDGSLGLGLAVAAEIVHQHGGTIRVEPAPHRGARFVVRFPLA